MKYFFFRGGLGNQMFQYSFMRYLEIKYSTKAQPTLMPDVNTHTGFELLRIFPNCQLKSAKFANSFVTKLLFKLFLQYRHRINLSFFEINKIEKVESKISLWKIIFHGFWEHFYYIDEIRETLASEFKFKKMDEPKNLEICDVIKNSNSVSVHIRRGDFVAEGKCICNGPYFDQAIDIINSEVKNPIYIFFSDDTNWVKTKFASLKNAFFVDWNKNMDSFGDVQLMSYCKHNIICNSTFSWWGAYLNNNAEKIVIAPLKWPICYNDKLIPTTWKRI